MCTDLALADDILLFGAEDGVVHAWDTASGEERWTFALPEGWSPARTIATADGHVFITADDLRPLGSHDKALLALSREDGRELWRYATPALRLSPPVVHAGQVYFAASDRAFHAVDAQSGERRWRVAIPGWGRSAPAASDRLVYFGTQAGPGGPGLVVALRADDGAVTWQAECAGTVLRPTIADDDLYVTSWNGNLYRFAAATGKPRWSQSVGSYILTPPAVLDGLIFVGARDRHVYAFDGENGEVVWQQRLVGKVRSALVVEHGIVYAGTSERRERTGKVFALDAETGEPIWPEPIDVEDRVEYAPASDGHHLYVATRHGILWSIGIREEAKALAPAAYEEQGDLEQAAAAYALQGDYAEAGRLYAELGEPYKAAELYRKAGEATSDEEARRDAWQRAGQLYEEAEVWRKARAVYRDLGSPTRVARTYARQERWAEAAARFEKAGSLAQAGEMYERAEQWDKAAQTYEQAGDIESAKRCTAKLGDKDKLARLLVAQGMFNQAAAEYEQIGDLARAAELYLEADPPRLADAAELYKRIEAWDQARTLFSQLGNLAEEAMCYQSLEEWEEAARLYEAAAQELEAEDQPDANRLAQLYGLAAQCWGEIFQRQHEAECLRKVIRYRRLPDLELDVKQQEPFVLGDKNVLLLTVKNVGFGVATDIDVETSGDFEGESIRSVPGLAVEGSQPLDFSVKPLESGRVLFQVEVSYRDRLGGTHTGTARTYVAVEREPPATPTDFTPQYIFHGDMIAYGGQKGDRVDIRRGERRFVVEAGEGTDSPDRLEIEGYQYPPTSGGQPPVLESRGAEAPDQSADPDTCPACNRELPDIEGLLYCNHCGTKLSNDSPGEEDH